MSLTWENGNFFDSFVQEQMLDWNIPGLAIAITHNDNNTWSKGYGFARLPEKQPVTPDTLFDCASTSKAYAAAGVAFLVEDNENYPDVQWDAPVSKLLHDDFVYANPIYTEQVSIEDILSHRSGMPRHDFSYLGINATNPDTPKSVVRNLRNLPVTKPLRTTFQYCNMLYTAATHLIESLSGESFYDYIKSRLYQPLGMDSTWVQVDRAQRGGAGDRIAKGYLWQEGAKEYKEVAWAITPEAQGAGSQFSCVSDYIKFVRMMIDQGAPLSKESHMELVKPRILEDNTPMPFFGPMFYALGWEVQSYRGYQVIGHDGAVTGFESLMRFLPELNFGIVVFGNANGAGNAADIIAYRLVDGLLGLDEESARKNSEQRLKFLKEREAEGTSEKVGQEGPFPERSRSALPLPVPLKALEGKYNNPGYHSLTFEVQGNGLFADATDRSNPWDLTVEHFSGEYFIATIRDTIAESTDSKSQSQFRLDPSGKPKQFGIFMDDAQQWIWFDRESDEKL